jgi:hypothetical protein
MPGTQKHTIWPDELLAKVRDFARARRRETGEYYPDDQAIRDLTEMGLVVAKRRAKRRAK